MIIIQHIIEHFAESSSKSYKNGREMAATETVWICARSMEGDRNPVKFHVSCISIRSVMIVKTTSLEHINFFMIPKSRTVGNNAEHFGSGGNNTDLHLEVSGSTLGRSTDYPDEDFSFS
jgi:hypothetical protein